MTPNKDTERARTGELLKQRTISYTRIIEPIRYTELLVTITGHVCKQESVPRCRKARFQAKFVSMWANTRQRTRAALRCFATTRVKMKAACHRPECQDYAFLTRT